MNLKKPSTLAYFLVVATLSLANAEAQSDVKTDKSNTEQAARKLVADDYSAVKHPTRNAARGNWKIAKGEASVSHDDVLYKKYKNHGPIMIYAVEHKDATAIIEFKPVDCRTVVFTMDAVKGGHAFRVKMRTQGKGKGGPPSQIVTYAAKKAGAQRAEAIVLGSAKVPRLKNNQWNRIEVTVRGERAWVKIGDETIEVKHERIAQSKKIVKLGFAFGSLSIRNFTLASR